MSVLDHSKRRGGRRRWTPGIAAAAVLLLSTTGFVLVDPADPPVLLRFLGRFHPMIIHFPIVLVLLAAVLEALSALSRSFRSLRYATTFVLVAGAGSAVLAAAAGFVLSLEGGYDEALVDAHKWLGASVAAGAILAAAMKVRLGRRRIPALRRAYVAVLAATTGAILATGHLGGSLTHGPTYLTYYMPGPMQQALGLMGGPAEERQIENIDSARVYLDLVFPIVESRCVECHNASKRKGGLRLDTPEHMLDGGDGGPVVEAGAPEESELWRRVTLPPDHDDVMPPDGAPPLTVGETELIRWWIASGASLDQQVADVEHVPSSVATVFARIAPPRPNGNVDLYAFEVPPADSVAIASLRGEGFGIHGVAEDIPLLHISTFNVRGALANKDLERLLRLSEHVTWLDLAGTNVDDEGLAVVAEMPHLTRLHLEHTSVGDAGLERLKGLAHLQYLNLVGTGVGDEGLVHLEQLRSLEVVYLWGTRVTPEGAARLKQRRPEVEVVLDAGTAPASS